MEDALISPEGFMILSGAGLVEASTGRTIKQHIMETIDADIITNNEKTTEDTLAIKISNKPYLPTDKKGDYAYVMLCYNGEVVSEPYIPEHDIISVDDDGSYTIKVEKHPVNYEAVDTEENHKENYTISGNFPSFDSVIVDYYTEKDSGAQQIEITADKFGGNYYLEASTLFRDQNGVDMPAEFIIPNCKIQSNFTFSMASSGDPSELMRLAA